MRKLLKVDLIDYEDLKDLKYGITPIINVYSRHGVDVYIYYESTFIILVPISAVLLFEKDKFFDKIKKISLLWIIW